MALGSGFLQDMSDLAQEFMDKDCEIWRSASTSDPYGSYDDDDYTKVADSKCFLGEPASNAQGDLLATYADRIGSRTISRVQFPLGTDVREGDRLIIDGQKLDVQVKLPRSYDVLPTVLASEAV
jgi:hypothetical protein